jgi:hypothetical protein
MGGSSSQHSKSQIRGDKRFHAQDTNNFRSASTNSGNSGKVQKITKIDDVNARYYQRQAELEA